MNKYWEDAQIEQKKRWDAEMAWVKGQRERIEERKKEEEYFKTPIGQLDARIKKLEENEVRRYKI